MPYIKQQDRDKLDSQIEALAEVLAKMVLDDPLSMAGNMNYTFSRVIMSVLTRTGGVRYHRIASITGMLKNVADEFYRRVAAPYEDGQIEKNGDIPGYGN